MSGDRGCHGDDLDHIQTWHGYRPPDQQHRWRLCQVQPKVRAGQREKETERKRHLT